jgi:hypothetical protein
MQGGQVQGGQSALDPIPLHSHRELGELANVRCTVDGSSTTSQFMTKRLFNNKVCILDIIDTITVDEAVHFPVALV